MSLQLKTIDGFNAIPIKIQMELFYLHGKHYPKIYYKATKDPKKRKQFLAR